ncbi:YitT family protein [Methanobrevibacter sp.]|uniref:YczE/YyaS/YitT family protein n=1 Tax=Methanobrevibacter sp. TaxID=66852 RepID=UPI0025D12F62|nr:DUF6198 family protein [Methanobrevibacter sp.]
MIKRVILFVVGLFIMSLGVGFSIVSTLGTTPVTSVAYSLALITNIDIGITTFLSNFALLLLQVVILRSRFEKKRLLQLINCVLFGYFMNVAVYIVSFVPFDGSILMKIIFLLISAFCIAFGIFTYVPAHIAPLPGEGCVQSIAMVTNWRFSTIKIGFDVLMLILSLILCGLFYTDLFASINIGTFVIALLIGFTLRQISNVYTRITGKKPNLVTKP